MSEYLTEEEQIEAFKRWWKQNGKLTLGAVVLGCAGYFGINGYHSMQEKTAQANSALYEKVAAAAAAGNDAALTQTQVAKLKEAANAVLQADGSTLYADLTHFHLAKIAVDAEDYEQAKSELNAVISNSVTQSSKELATLRLARVESALGNAEAALSLLANSPSEAFVASYGEMKGDVLAALGRLDEAYTAYESASAALEGKQSGNGMRANILKFKMDNARVASASPLANPHNQVESLPVDATEAAE